MRKGYSMEKIKELIDIGFDVNWKLIKIGYLGNSIIQPQLSKKDICDYGYWILENTDDNISLISQLIGEVSDDYEFNNILFKLSKTELVDVDIQIRKWIVYMLSNKLSSLSKDYFEGILEITEFWVSLGQPNNCPHIFQGVGNTITPEEYYTKEIYDMVILNHKNWLNKEIKDIILLENKYKKLVTT